MATPPPGPVVDPYETVAEAPPASLIPETVIVRPETDTVPALDVVNPAEPEETDGVLHPVGTTTESPPEDNPPGAAV